MAIRNYNKPQQVHLKLELTVNKNSVIYVSDKIKANDKHILSSIIYDDAPSIRTKNVEF